MTTTLDTLTERGFVADCSDAEGLRQALAAEGGLRFYVGCTRPRCDG